MTIAEFQDILKDASKRIVDDIRWAQGDDHPHRLEFESSIESDSGYPLFAVGTYVPRIEKLTYSVIDRREGRIYGVCIGSDHRGAEGLFGTERHIHRLGHAELTNTITAPASDPRLVWIQFCQSFGLQHLGEMYDHPPVIQMEF